MEVLVKYENGNRFSATCRDYTVTTGKGEDGKTERDGMWPAQLFSASIGMCIGSYVIDYCKENNIPYEDMAIELSRRVKTMPQDKSLTRTAKMDVNIRLSEKLSDEHKKGILEVADRCHITKSIERGMEIECSIE